MSARELAVALSVELNEAFSVAQQKRAERILAALSAAGYVIVPREPTEAMLYAAEAVFESAFSPESGETLAEAIRAALLAALEPKP